jgi:hypothetical protein
MRTAPFPKRISSESDLPDKTGFSTRKTVIDKKGREWEEITYSKSFLWKLGMGLSAFFVTLGTGFFGLFSKNIRNLWLKAISGKEIYWIRKEAIDSRTESIRQIGTQVLEMTSEKKQILNDYGKEMVEALGGIDKVVNLPVLDLTKWDGTLNPEQFTGPVIRGKFANEPVLIFCYVPYDNRRICGDFLRRRVPRNESEDQRWIAGGRGIRGELDFAMGNEGVPPNSEIEKQMFDRLHRLMSGKPVGRIQSYNESVVATKKNISPPKDAYLKGVDLEAFMKLDTYYYERDPTDQAAELTLFPFDS